LYEILNQLNKIEGVHGSLIMGADGLVIAAELGTDVDENAVAAVGSQILGSLQGALRRMQMGGFQRFVVTGRDGKIILANAGSVIVVLLLDLDANLGLVSVDVKEAIQEIQRKVRMT
jgi:predicted regulator of Ras-like GTPase activity (Roadblock/LC7/MglB family)